MKTAITAFAAVVLLISGNGWAAQETDPVQDIAQYWEQEQAQRAERQARLQELMSTLAEEMEAIRGTTDKSKSQALLATHRANMHEAMGLMIDMGGPHLRDVLAEHIGAGAGAGGKHQHAMPMQAREHMSDSVRLSDIENRLDMLQIIIESILADQSTH